MSAAVSAQPGPAAGGFPVLRTARLVLREIVPADAPALFAIHADAEHMRWFGSEPLTELAQARKLIELFAGWRRQPDPGTRWAIERRADGAFIGTCGLFKWNRGWSNCRIGYELVRSAQGEGFMREALAAVLDYGFRAMLLNRVDANVHPDNVSSIRLLRALGFVHEGRLREAGYWAGHYHDLEQFGLLRREYRSPKLLRR